LQKKEQDLRKEIAELTNMMVQTQKNKKLSLNQLAIIKKKSISVKTWSIRSTSRYVNWMKPSLPMSATSTDLEKNWTLYA